MKQFLKALYSWVVRLLQSIVSFLSVLCFSTLKSTKGIKRLVSSENIDECVILGNGPSLKKTIEEHVNELKQYDLLAVNLFCDTDAFSVLQPKYYVLTDPAFFDENTKVERVKREQQKLKEGFSKVEWEMMLFLPSINRKSHLVKEISNERIKVVFYNLTPVDGFLSFQHLLFRLNMGMPQAMNVLCASVFLMVNTGYKRIYLLGADHSWLESFYVNDRNQVILGDKHFYGDQSVVCPYTLSKWLLNVSTGFKTHERLSEYANFMGAKIYNATEGSYIDAYERNSLF